MRWIFALFILQLAQAAIAEGGNAVYDSNPNHPWNLLNKALFERTGPDHRRYGLDTLDILYWGRTTHLLAGPSQQQALSALDDFINSHGEKLIHDPLKKALLQRDLWALFDWAAGGLNANRKTEPTDLLKRLAIVIQRLELTTNEIASLPDNYSPAEKNNLTDLPRGLFNTNGDWINISIPNAFGLVPAHDLSFGGRSFFMVLFHDADGRKAGLNYLKQLAAVNPMYGPSRDTNDLDDMPLNPHFAQFPAKSQWALVRRMRVIDTDGKTQTTRVVESIQLRTYLGFGEPEYVAVTNADGTVGAKTIPPQRFNEFEMTRPSAQIISRGQQERAFTKSPFSNGIDMFESGFGGEGSSSITNNFPIALQTCFECHSGPGIYSVNCFNRRLSLEFPRANTIRMIESDGSSEQPTDFFSEIVTRFQWGLLQGLWMQRN